MDDSIKATELNYFNIKKKTQEHVLVNKTNRSK